LVHSNLIVGAALLLGTPLFVFFGNLSDKIGRKQIMLWGMVAAVVLYYPIYGAMASFAPPPKDPTKPMQLFLFPYVGYKPVMLSLLVFLQVVFVTMVYGPIAAFLVELFPTKIRYTSMSLPYHIGNGVFGGMVPIIGLTLINTTHNNFAGLWYPMAIAAVCAIIGFWKLPETHHVDISSDHSIASTRTSKPSSTSGRRILVPLDGSKTSEAVLAHAQALAKADGSELVLLQVVNSAGEIFNDPSIGADDLSAAEAAETSYLEGVLARIKSEGASATIEVREGPIADTILATARDLRVNMIAMSTHGRSGLQKMLMGSITEGIVKNSPVPVLVIRPKGD
jgi:nucleotide-binding universal stress UspA family protein